MKAKRLPSLEYNHGMCLLEKTDKLKRDHDLQVHKEEHEHKFAQFNKVLVICNS